MLIDCTFHYPNIMHIQYKKNIHFTRLIKAAGRLREFNFRRVSGNDADSVFTVDVSDDRGNRILFKMTRQDNAWRIEPQTLPVWVTENENNFNEIIEEELRRS